MKGDAAKAKRGDVVLHKFGRPCVLGERKYGDRLPGWWVVGGGGLADSALDSDDWRLLDQSAMDRVRVLLWSAPTPASVPGVVCEEEGT